MYQALVMVILVLLCFAGVCADVLIIYTLLRFKKLRNSFNTFLANWAISDLCSIILVPVTYAITFLSRSVTKEFVCILVQAAVIFHVTEILFGIVLCIDWCLAAYFQRLSEKFKIYYRYVIACVWVLTLLFYCIVTGLCIAHTTVNVDMTMILFAVFYAICVIFVIGLQCSRVVQNCRSFPRTYPKPLPLRLTLITVIICSYLFVVIHLLLMFLETIYHRNDYVFISGIVSICAVLSSSVLTLILLCWLNYDFRQCLFQLKISVQNESLNNDVSEAADASKSTPEFVFHSSTQNIVPNVHADLI